MPFLISDSRDGARHMCLFTCLRLLLWVTQLSALTKKHPSVPSFTCDNGPWKLLMAAMLLFKAQEMVPPAHWLEEKSSGTSIMEMQNTQWCGGTMRGHFIHSFFPLSPPFQGVGGAWGDSYPRGRQRSYVRKFSFIARPKSCWVSMARRSFMQQFVLSQLDV